MVAITPTSSQPLIYGYLRLQGDEPDADVRRTELVLKDYADVKGYCFATVFHEYESGTYAAFAELMEELQRAEAHDVVVPTLNHLSAHRLMQRCMLDKLADVADATVHVLDTPVVHTRRSCPQVGSRVWW